jgi:NitT/TauT family transport system substrate-binding protein
MNNELSTPITRRQALKAGAAGGAMLGLGALAGPAVAKTYARPASALTTINDQLGWVKTSQWGGQYAAIANGYYKAEGISDNLISGGPNITASEVVAAGHATLAEDDNQSVLQLIAKGLPLIIFGTIYQRSPYSVISLKSAPIKTLKDFKGKTIAIPSATEAYLNPALTKAGVDPSTVTYVPANDPTQLSSNQVQGYFGFSTDQGAELAHSGVPVDIVSLWDLGIKSYGNVLITTKKFYNANKPLLVRYLTATIKGWEYALEHPEKIAKLTVSKFAPPGDSYETELLNAVAQVPLIKNPKGIMKINTTEMQEVIDGMVGAGALTKKLKASDVMTTEILDAVYGKSTSLKL